MGDPMAMHLARAGHDLSVYNRTRSKAEAFVSEYAVTRRPRRNNTKPPTSPD